MVYKIQGFVADCVISYVYNRINLAHLLCSCKAGHFSMLNILCNAVSLVSLVSSPRAA